MARTELAAKIDALMGGLAADLSRLARLPSGAGCAGPPRRLVPRAHDLLVELLRAAGVQSIRDLTLPDGKPLVAGSIKPPTPEAPTVLLYADYDMRTPGEAPAPDPLLVHLGALRAFDGRPPVGVEIVFAGQETPLGQAAEPSAAPRRPEDYDCDAMLYHPRASARVPAGVRVPAGRDGHGGPDRHGGPDGCGQHGRTARDGTAALTELRGAVLAEARFLEHYAADFVRVSR
jgi:hypothetical protein